MHRPKTHHAMKRMRQRGIRDHEYEILARLADEERPVGRNLSALSLSRVALQEAVADGLAPALVGRLQRLVLIEARDGAVVTIGQRCGRKAKGWQRRERRKYWRS